MRLTIQKQKWLLMVISFLCGYWFVKELCFIDVLHIGQSESLFIMTLLGLAIAYGGYLYWRDFQCNFWVMAFSFVITCVGIIGFLLRTSGGNGVFEYFPKNILLCGITGCPAVSWLVSAAYERLVFQKEEAVDEKIFPKYFWFAFAIIFVAWVPVFLAYFPGVFAYDVHTQLNMVKEMNYTTHHPLLHTFLLQFFYLLGENIGSYNAGIAMYTILQMVLVALVLAYALWYLYTKGVNRTVRIVILLFFAFCPINSVLAISVTKDTLFSAAVLLFVILVLQFIEDEAFRKSRLKCGILVGSGILVYLLRNNAKYALAVWAIAFVIFLYRSKFDKFGKHLGVGIAVGILVIAQLTNTIMVKSVDASPGSINEMLSIPSAQIARCYAFRSSEMNPQMLQDMELLGITPGDYVLPTVDIVKGRIRIEGQEAHFFDVWWRLFKQYTGVSIDAFLYINQGNISLDDTSTGYVYGASLEERMGYLLTNTAKGYGVEHHSLFPWLENIYEHLFSANEYQSIPLFSTLFVPALYFWLLALCMLHALLSKNYKVIVVGILLLLYYGTVLFGPCALIRYMFPLVLSSPVLLGLELHQPRVNLRRENKR